MRRSANPTLRHDFLEVSVYRIAFWIPILLQIIGSITNELDDSPDPWRLSVLQQFGLILRNNKSRMITKVELLYLPIYSIRLEALLDSLDACHITDEATLTTAYANPIASQGL